MRRLGESKGHEKQKQRLGRILESKGWKVYVDSYEFECETPKGDRTYTPDIYATKRTRTSSKDIETWKNDDDANNGLSGHMHRLIIEVQGSHGKGNHSTKIHRGKDANRIEDIKINHELEKGDKIIYIPIWDWVIQRSTDEEVWEEIEYYLLKNA